jgi:hypothetical protein
MSARYNSLWFHLPVPGTWEGGSVNFVSITKSFAKKMFPISVRMRLLGFCSKLFQELKFDLPAR